MADKQVDRPAPSEEAMEAVLLMLPPNDRSLYIIADAVDEKFEPLRRQIAQLRRAIESTGARGIGDWICWCGGCIPPNGFHSGVRRSHKCVTLAEALSSTATEKTEAEK
jgi:hypothetical protein